MTSISERISKLPAEKRALLEQRLRAARSGEHTPQIPRRDDALAVASFGEERLWLLEQIDGPSPLYNVPIAVEMTGPVDVAAINAALTGVVARHEPLRTRYVSREGRLGVEIGPAFDVPLQVVDLGSSPESERQLRLDNALEDEARRVFALHAGLLLRAVLFRCSEHHHVLLMTVHHIAIDGWSLSVLLRDFQVFYNASVAGTEPRLPALAIRYTDFASWQRERVADEELERLSAHWTERLKGSPFVLDLPTDRPRPTVHTIEGGVRQGRLSPKLMTELKALCRGENATPYMALMAAVVVVLSRWCRTTDVLVGSPIAGRVRAETEGLVGLFLNTLVLRADVSGAPSFREMLRRVRDTAWDAYAYQEMPFEKLVGVLSPPRQVNRAPIFQVMVALQNTPVHDLRLSGLTSSVREVHTRTSKFDLAVWANEADDGLDATLEYSAALFDPGTIDRFWLQIVAFLMGGLVGPEQSVHAIPILSTEERTQVVVEWNRTEATYPKDVPLAELVERAVARTPEAVAVVSGEETVTYYELNSQANQLASVLRAKGAGPDVLVGVCVERSVALVVALLAVIKAGAAYLPLDPLLPPERLQFMLDDSRTSLVVADASSQKRLRDFSGTVVNADSAIGRGRLDQNPTVAVTAEHLAYVIYTSGSTGRPKGAAIRRGSFANFLWSMGDWLKMTERDRFLALTTISFDIAGLELWLPLLVGGTVVLAGGGAAADGWTVARLVAKHDITFMFATPVSWRLLLEAGWAGKRDLCAVCGGEALLPDLAARLVPAVRQLWNFYGPTETTVASTGCLVSHVSDPIPIGRPLANTRCYILDEHGQPVPVGVPGELHVAGDGLARGYLNRPELTAERFVPDPFDADPNALMYRTGDLARYRPDGQIECLGRTDHQVKIRGFRIEPGEIEARLAECEGIAQSVVVPRSDAGREKRLVAYVVAKPGCDVTPSRLREQLRRTLAEYMVPASFVILGALPLTPNGKVDRGALPSPDPASPAPSGTYRPPRNPVEFALAAAWAEVLSLDRVGIDDNFFDLGGDSLLSVALLSRVLTLFPGTQPSLARLLEAPTPAEFSEVVGRSGVPVDIVVKVKDGGPGRAPFFCIPGVGGNILSLRPLALAMPDEVPFYCLQAKGLDGSAPFETVEDTARCYVERIREIQSSGPYHLGGACYGGVVAFETARLLEAAGESVHVLALIDTTNAAYARSLPLHRVLAMNLRYYLPRIRQHVQQLTGLSAAEKGARIKTKLGMAFRLMREMTGLAVGSRAPQLPDTVGLPVVADDSELTRILARVTNASLHAARTFVPGPYGGRILLVMAKTQEPQVYDDNRMGWSPVARGGITSVEVPGDHNTILVEPRVRAVAHALSEALERSGDYRPPNSDTK